LPALIALCGWIFVFLSAGGAAIAFGIVTLLIGSAIFLAGAARRRRWPFAPPVATLRDR
jgi:hypothetical protein